jgi:hypothetical protein
VRLSLPEGSRLFADKIYTDYDYADHLQADRKLTFLPLRNGNLKRRHAPALPRQIRSARKRLETAWSQVTAKLPHRLHAVTLEGFESKIMARFVAFAILLAQTEE